MFAIYIFCFLLPFFIESIIAFDKVKPICIGDQHREGKWVYDSSLVVKGKSFYCCGDGDETDTFYNIPKDALVLTICCIMVTNYDTCIMVIIT